MYVPVFGLSEYNLVLIISEDDLLSLNSIEHLERPNSKIIQWFGQCDVSKSKKFYRYTTW
jgi:hypothetical protein